MCAVTKSDLFEESLSWLYIHIPLPYYVHTCTSHKEHVSLGCVRTSSQVFKVKDWSQICLESSFDYRFSPLALCACTMTLKYRYVFYVKGQGHDILKFLYPDNVFSHNDQILLRLVYWLQCWIISIKRKVVEILL